jgi:serine/threonine protein kinase
MEKNYDLIGKGQFGLVYKVTLKKINTTEQEFINEINILKKLESDYSVRYIEHYKTDNEYNLIMELFNCISLAYKFE